MILKNGKRMDTVLDNLPIGTINCFGSSVAPTGWLICDGSAISRTIYSELFSVIGTTYGTGDGSTTFNLPDYRGKIGVGYSNGDTDFGTLGKTGGEKTHTLTVDEMPSHRHSQQVTLDTSSSAGNIRATVVGGGSVWSEYDSNQIKNEGGSQPHNNLQPYITINYIIKVYMVIPVNSSVYNALDSTSTTDALSANQGKILNDKLNYSTNEIIVGTWIDGKPVYRKVIEATASTIVAELTSLNIKRYLSFWGQAISTYSNVWPIPNTFRPEAGYDIYTMWDSSFSNLTITFGTYYNSGSVVKIIVEYTKTTD